MRIIFYIDDTLLMAESKEKLQDQSAGLIYLLECLGLTLNQEKTVLHPSQSIVFLGFTIDTTKMELSLPPDKIKKIRVEAQKLLGVELVSTHSLSQLLGGINATTEVIPPAPLFFRCLQMDLAAALGVATQDYKTHLSLSPASKEELI